MKRMITTVVLVAILTALLPGAGAATAGKRGADPAAMPSPVLATADCWPDWDGDGLCSGDYDGDGFYDDQCWLEHGPASNCGCPVENVDRQVDLVFVMDTSGSMGDEFNALCAKISTLVTDLQANGIGVRHKILGIDRNYACTTDYVTNLIWDATSDHPEDWGPATRDVSVAYGWAPGYTRVIVPMSDEGADNGDPWSAADTAAIDTAIKAATRNGVRVAPVLCSGWPAGMDTQAQRLADGTGGDVFYSTDPANDLADGIAAIVEAIAADRDGDGVPDCKDADAEDSCRPDPEFCWPQQDCGDTNTPHLDDDGDGSVDEEIDNGTDDDGDGLADEDVGGVDCPYPQQECGLSNHRNFDDDMDGSIDEEDENGQDDDGDSYVDEDIHCSCPPPQDVGLNDTPGIDDDKDTETDEEADDGADDDGDGCIDEDVRAHRVYGTARHPCPTNKDPGLLCPVDGVDVQAGGEAVQTDDKGEYELDLDPGTYNFEFSAPAYQTVSIEDVTVETSEQVQVDALMIFEECLPPAISCAVDVAHLVKMVNAQTAAVKASAEVAGFMNSACEYGKRMEEGNRVWALVSFTFAVFDMLNWLLCAGGDELCEALEGLLDCMQSNVYATKVADPLEPSISVQKLHAIAEMEGKPDTMTVYVAPSLLDGSPDKLFNAHVYDLLNGGHLGVAGDALEQTIAGSHLIDTPIQIGYVESALGEYLVEVEGDQNTSLDLAIVHPNSDGTFSTLVWEGVATTAVSTASVSVGPPSAAQHVASSTYDLILDLDGDGIPDQQIPPSEVETLDYSSVHLPSILRGDSPIPQTPNLPPNVPAELWPTSGLANQSPDLNLTWIGGDPDGDDVTYYVYLEAGDGTPDQLACNCTPNPACRPASLDSGTHYFWRVVARDEVGATRQGPVWEFSTGGQAPNQAPYAPGSPAPPDGATAQLIDVDLSWTGGDPDPGDVVSYDVYIDTATTPSTLVCDDAASTTCDPGALAYDTHYYWYVVASDDHGASTTGDTWDFTTAAAPADIGPLVFLGTFVDDDASGQSVGNGDYTVNCGETIELYVSLLNQGTATAENVYATISSSDPYIEFIYNVGSGFPDIEGGTWSWNSSDYDFTVEPATPDGHLIEFQLDIAASAGGPWSDTFALPVTCNSAPHVPGSPSPADGATDQPLDVDLAWTGGDPDAGDTVTYDVYLEASNPPPSTACIDVAGLSCDPGTLAYDTQYFWYVLATDSHGAQTAGSTWSFTTTVTPTTVGPLVYGGQVVDDDALHNSYGNGDGIVDCGEIIELYVGLSNSGSSTAILVDTTLSTSDPYAELFINTSSTYPDIGAGETGWNENDYDFTVDLATPDGHEILFDLDIIATNGGPWTDSFTVPVTCNSLPYEPHSPSPSDGVTEQALDVDLNWIGGDPDPGDSVTYQVFLDSSTSPSTTVCIDLPSPACDPGPLDPDQQYYWYVEATDNHGATTPGPVWDFATTAIQQVLLQNGNSYDFSTGTFGMYSGGDFYLSGLRFIANNIGQRGLQSLGDIGSVPLATVTIPAGGYSIFGADAVLWHTYVSLAQSGEEGNHIVFRVQEIVGDSVLIDYLYVTE